MTTRDKNIQKIKDACVRANPEIETLRTWSTPEGETSSVIKDSLKIYYRPIRLADVLLAIEAKQYPYLHLVSEAGYFYREIPNGIEMIRGRSWNLRHDDLTLQSDETLEFIASLV